MEDAWPCQNGDGCVYTESVCDGYIDCNDKSDEYESICLAWDCKYDMVKCSDNKLCFSPSSLCDGKWDCLNGLDEMDCISFTCMTGKVKCANNVQCIYENEICDELMHCADGSDELCMATCLETSLYHPTIIQRCLEDFSKCFPIKQFCDGVADCPFGSDEAKSGCTCEDWNMNRVLIEGSDLCIPKDWTSLRSSDMYEYDVGHQPFSVGKSKNCTGNCLLLPIQV